MVKKRKTYKEVPVWKDKSMFEKLLAIMGLILSIAIIILATLQVAKIWKDSIYVYEPLLGVLMLIQAAENWKYNKVLSFISLGAFGIVLLFSLYVFSV